MISGNYLQRIVLTLDDGTVYDTNGSTDNLKISFSATNNISSAANLTRLKLYNLSPATQQKLINNRFGATLAVGYTFGDTTLRVVTTGSTGIANPQREGPNIITNVALVDGALGTAISTFSKTFQSGQPVATVTKEVAQKISGATVTGDNIHVVGNLGPKGVSYSGGCTSILDRLKRNWGFGWSIQKGIFYAFTDGRGSQNVFPVSVEAGNLINAGRMIDNSIQVLTGIQVTTVLDARISPYDSIELVSTVNPDLNGTYHVTSIQHVGDSHPEGGQNVWFSVITCLFFSDPRISTAAVTP